MAVARGPVAVAALAERAEVARTQRAHRRPRQPPRTAVQPPCGPRLWDPLCAPYRPMLTDEGGRRAVCRPQAPAREMPFQEGTRGGRLDGWWAGGERGVGAYFSHHSTHFFCISCASMNVFSCVSVCDESKV